MVDGSMLGRVMSRFHAAVSVGGLELPRCDAWLRACLGASVFLFVGACGDPQETSEAPPSESAPPNHGDVSCADDPRVDALTDALERAGEAGELTFVLQPHERGVVRGENELQWQVLHGGVSVTDAALEVEATMPDHGHGTRQQPVIRFDPETETYSVGELDFFMPGVWRVQVSCPAQTGEEPELLDSAEFFFCVEG